MTFFSILETVLIGPLKLIFEIIFDYANRFVGHPGLAIIFLSLMMNILVLPLYRRADAMQEETRDREAKLRDGVAHIKKTFSGDERMMILQTYYRQNHYKPTDALNGSVSLLLEIPFFLAAYQFLSHVEILNGVSFGPIRDLGAPDGLLVIGGVAINLLPILMTLINAISSALYLKGFPLKTKIQLYAMALFFLVFLYTSPACLVFYWTLNNVFSLVKTIFYKLKNPQKILRWLTAAIGAALVVFGVFFYRTESLKRKIVLVFLGILLLLPFAIPHLKKILPAREKKSEAQPNRKLFLLGSVFLTVLVGLLIPSVFIAASPQEYVDVTYFHNPLWYLVSSLCMAAGTFLVWMRVFYWLASARGKVIFDRLIWALCGVMLVNYMFFGTNLGILSSVLQYENGVSFSWWQQVLNFLVLAAVAAVLIFCVCKWKRVVIPVLIAAILALSGMSAVNFVTINHSVQQIALQQEGDHRDPHFGLSKTGQNVVVIMLDRALGETVPYIFREKPELKEQFSGFTYYKNTISFGGFTNFGSPALFGGYEYTPIEMNKRKNESLVSKHNEALKMMPALFAKNGYQVTVCDPAYANYRWVPDLSIYDEIPGVNAYITNGMFSDPARKEAAIQSNYRNFFCFSMMKSMPLFMQVSIYDAGRYHQMQTTDFAANQTREGMSLSNGMNTTFTNPYNVLVHLPNLTKVTDDPANTFLLLTNDSTHEPMLLQEPDYVPAEHVDNAQYDAENAGRFVVDGRELKVENDYQMIHYHANMAALIQLGNWFDSLRANGVYDNTRIILVADHGQSLGQISELIADNGIDKGHYFPLFMVKDFDSEGFTTSDDFMTNADVPTLAVKDLIPNPKNPFTGKPINSDEKFAHDQFIIVSNEWKVEKNNGNAYLPSKWASVHDNLWDKNNWAFYNGEAVLDQYVMP